jgi:hypothetical protein
MLKSNLSQKGVMKVENPLQFLESNIFEGKNSILNPRSESTGAVAGSFQAIQGLSYFTINI